MSSSNQGAWITSTVRCENVSCSRSPSNLGFTVSWAATIPAYSCRGSSNVSSLSDEHLLRFQKIQAIRRPTIRNQTSVFNFVRNTDSLVYEEYEWIKQGIDLAALAHDGEHGWFNGFIEDLLNKFSRKSTLVKCNEMFDPLTSSNTNV